MQTNITELEREEARLMQELKDLQIRQRQEEHAEQLRDLSGILCAGVAVRS